MHKEVLFNFLEPTKPKLAFLRKQQLARAHTHTHTHTHTQTELELQIMKKCVVRHRSGEGIHKLKGKGSSMLLI